MLLPLELQKEAAQKALDEFTAKATRDFGAVAGAGNKVNVALDQIAASSKKMELGQALDRGISKFGDLKDIVEKTGASFFGLSKESAVAAGAALDMSQKFASLGSVFGPLGTAIGAATGALVGWITSSKDAAVAETELTKKVQEETDKRNAIREGERRQGIRDATERVESYSELEQKIKDTEQALKESGLSSVEQGKLLRARKTDTLDLSEAYDKLTLAQERGSPDDVKDAQWELNRAMSAGQKDIAVIGAAIDDYTAKQKKATGATKELAKAVKDGDIVGVKGPTVVADMDKAKSDLAAFNQRAADEQERTALAALDKQESYNAKLEAASRAHYQRVADNRRKIEEEDAKEAEALRLEGVASLESQLGRVTSITGELTAQLEANVAAGAGLFNEFGVAAERGVSQVLKALGKEWTVKAIGEAAEGFSALAANRYKAASEHFIGAAEFGLAATAAGVGGAVIGGDASRRGAQDSGTTGGGGTSGGPGDSRISDPGTQNLTPIVIKFETTVPMSERQQQEAAQNIQGFLDRGKRK